MVFGFVGGTEVQGAAPLLGLRAVRHSCRPREGLAVSETRAASLRYMLRSMVDCRGYKWSLAHPIRRLRLGSGRRR